MSALHPVFEAALAPFAPPAERARPAARVSTHTPGEWYAEGAGVYCRATGAERGWLLAALGTDATESDEVAEQVANARLMAAAPAMYEALCMALTLEVLPAGIVHRAVLRALDLADGGER